MVAAIGRLFQFQIKRHLRWLVFGSSIYASSPSILAAWMSSLIWNRNNAAAAAPVRYRRLIKINMIH